VCECEITLSDQDWRRNGETEGEKASGQERTCTCVVTTPVRVPQTNK